MLAVLFESPLLFIKFDTLNETNGTIWNAQNLA